MPDPLLSICMIVKNEEVNLERCLDSFLPIIYWKNDETLERLIELIVVDTGSTDRTVNVAKKHTDKIFIQEFIPWDFSAARNFGIKKAKGKKILIVDADEELPQQWVYYLKNLIMNPKYDQFPTIFFWIRNFYNKENTEYSRFKQPRLFLNNGFKFDGDIHNKPTAKPPYCFSEVELNHYGYKFTGDKGKELAKKKTERSLPMLLESHQKDQHDTHFLTHICKTYRIDSNWDKVIEYGEKWLAEMKALKDAGQMHEGWFAYFEVFIDLVDAYLQKKDFENAHRIKKEAEEFSQRLPDIYVLFWFAYIQIDPEKSVEYGEKVIHILKTQESVYEELLTTNIPMLLPRIYNNLAIYYYQKRELLKAGQYLNDGILSNDHRAPLRWDVWNCEDKLVKEAA